MVKAEMLESAGPWIAVPIGSAGAGVLVVGVAVVVGVIAATLVVTAALVVVASGADVLVGSPVVGSGVVGSGVVVAVVGVVVTGTAVGVAGAVCVGPAARANCPPAARLSGVAGGEESSPH